jgi:hypothetical protein
MPAKLENTNLIQQFLEFFRSGEKLVKYRSSLRKQIQTLIITNLFFFVKVSGYLKVKILFLNTKWSPIL